MLLTIDIGNTNTVFALCDTKGINHSWRCKTDAARTADEYIAFLLPMFAQAGLSLDDVSDAILSSVVPDANENICHLCEKLWAFDPVIVTADLIDMPIKLDNPQEIGADRLVNAIAVIAEYRTPAIVIDFGTATTFDVVNAKGEYCGGAIAPGVNLSMKALHEAAAKLPRINIEKPPKVMGTSTDMAMKSGVYWGYVGMIEGLLERLSAEIDGKPFILATGGLASLFSGAVPAIEKVDQELTLRGLVHIYQSYKSRKAA